MNKQLKFITRSIFAMFIVLFGAITIIQVVQAEELRANPLNKRTTYNAFSVERGEILVDGSSIASSIPTSDAYQFQRVYENGPLYAPITGYFSHYQGITGIEAAMNSELSGLGNTQFFTRVMRIITGEKPQGSAVELTIDPAVQQAAWDALQGYEGSVVALNPTNGKILAMVSTPSFDPNLMSSNNDLEIIDNYKALQDDPSKPLMNRAIGGDLFHPGSTYKLLTTAAALESGAAEPSTEFKNDQAFKLPGSSNEMHNYGLGLCGSGDKVTLADAVKFSCNVPMGELAGKMDRDEIPKMAAAFGFGQELSIPLTVTPSQAPVPETDAEAAISSIGQLDVRATPMQMAMVSAGIANGGVVMQPQLVNQVLAPNFSVEKSFTEAEFANPISAKTASQLTAMMVAGVNETDGAAYKARIEGTTVAGKTGTAQNGTDAAGNDLPYTLWFTGFAPSENPEVAVAVVIANGGGEAHNFQGTSYEIPTNIGKQVMEAVLSQ
ncbi:MAG: peptidoglycan D,D-transpeptidase FtsI family protein [Microbacteriaceae bacterium]